MRHLWTVSVVACVIVAAACTGSGPGLTTLRSPMPGEIVSTLDGVSLSVLVDPNPAARAEDVTIVATLRNDRGSDVDYEGGGCAFASLMASFPTPREPTGRTWSGQEGWFKDYLLNHSYGSDSVFASTPPDEMLLATPCLDSIPFKALLAPRDEIKADFTAAIRNALRGNPHLASVPFSITANIDRQNDPEPVEPGYSGIPPRFFPIYRNVTVTGVLSMGGQPTDLLSAGEAIDVLLANDAFVTWLHQQPAGTCETANLDLDSLPGNGDGPGWFINLWCETGVPRHRGGAWVDAQTGEIKKLEMCGDPCT